MGLSMSFVNLTRASINGRKEDVEVLGSREANGIQAVRIEASLTDAEAFRSRRAETKSLFGFRDVPPLEWL